MSLKNLFGGFRRAPKEKTSIRSGLSEAEINRVHGIAWLVKIRGRSSIAGDGFVEIQEHSGDARPGR